VSWIDESRRLRASAPSSEGLRKLGAVLGEGVEIVGPLHGGVASSVYELATASRRLVLKRFMYEEAAPFEWERLHIARAAPVPTPEPVALDAEGEWFGAPALVVTYIDGGPMYPPKPEALGRVLAAIHVTPLPDPVPPVLLRPALWALWEERVALPCGVVDAIYELQTIAANEPVVFCHCDLHPGNVLIADHAVTGVVDWSSARLAPPGLDLALTRCDLAIVPGGDAPDRFLRAYEAASGRSATHLPLWDALAAARALEHGDGWVDAWTDTGVPMTAERIRERATEFAEAAIALI
jgi:aminoglycoside phosphotransferase (APT) family kinase protein